MRRGRSRVPLAIDCLRSPCLRIPDLRIPCLWIPCLCILTQGLGSGAATAWSQTQAQNPKQSQKESQKESQAGPTDPPPLTPRTLYHPEEEFDFVGSVPTTHWIGDAPSELLIRRDQDWQRLDLTTGQESPWPILAQLRQQIASLEGVSPEQAASAAADAVAQMKSPRETLLVTIDQSLAVVSPDRPGRWLTRDASGWKNATLDPVARRVAYTSDGDLFVLDPQTGQTMRLTDDGSETQLDGILDWTYQEEIFGRGNFKGFWFSPDGQWLAMLHIDTGGVEPYILPSAESDRGQGIVSRYPKAGDPIPHAQLWLWDLRQIDRGVVPPPRVLGESSPQQSRLFTGVWWNPFHQELWWTVSDRRQTWRELRALQVDPRDGIAGDSSLVLREESPAWVEPPAEPGWLRDGGFLWRSNLPSGRSRLYHVARDGKRITPVSPEDFDVGDFHARPDGEFVLVSGDASHGTVYRHLYRIDLRQADRKLRPLTSDAGWHATSVSPDLAWYVDTFSTPSQPPSVVVRSTEGDQHWDLAQSEWSLREPMIEPEIIFIDTPDGPRLPAMLIRPPTADANHPSPVVIEVYGGPRAPAVSARWAGVKTLYRETLARRGIATLIVDNRSSAGRGIADTWSIRHRVGEVELKDLLTAVDWLRSQPWVDSQRLAIRGWSFGGYLTLYAMTHSDAFAAGIAGGSVTQWNEYDAFYTERYMGLPSENPEGYRTTSPLAAADRLHGNVLLIHGEADDNVHPSGTLRMAAALQRAGKEFRLMIYPGAAHGISDPKQRWHMVQMTDRFLVDELLGGDPRPGNENP